MPPSGRRAALAASTRTIAPIAQRDSRAAPRARKSAASARAERVGRLRVIADGRASLAAHHSLRRRGSRAARAATARRARNIGIARRAACGSFPTARARTRARAVVASVVSRSASGASAATTIGAIGAALDRQRALPGGGQAFLRIEQRRDPLGEAEPLQAGGREDDRVVLPSSSLRKRVLTLPRSGAIDEQRIALAQLRFAAQARRADARAAGQPGERRDSDSTRTRRADPRAR